MADDGVLAKKGRGLKKPGHLPPTEVLEIVARDEDGEFIAIPSDWDEDAHGAPPRVLILPERGRGSGPAPGIGDRVLTRIAPNETETDGPSHVGRVIRTLAKPDRRAIGVFRAQPDGSGLLEPVDKKRPDTLFVDAKDRGDAEDGDLVVADVIRGRRYGPNRAKIRERVGDMQSEHAASLIALATHDIPIEFPEEVLKEAEAATPVSQEGREDLTKVPFVTIDPADARDHDDAVHAEPDTAPDNQGGHVVMVAIADVAAYVRPGTALDRSARDRGNSVYFPDRVVPMLPERLSNDLCSLRPDEVRPVLVARMRFTASGRKVDARFQRAMIRSVAKLAYPQAQAAIDGRTDETTAPLLDPVLSPLWAAYAALAEARDTRGPLALDLPERRLVLDARGHVDQVITPERLDAHRLIEEFMIQANVAAAEVLEAQRTPLIYRVHDSPSLEKVKALRDFLDTLSLKVPQASELRPRHFNQLLAQVDGTEHQDLVNEVILRSQAQAEYSPDNYGHFGLNLRRYAHFTSPIRRYADLVVHRALIRALGFGKDGLTDPEIEKLAETAASISAAERRAMAAERETVDRLIAHHLADRIGAKFRGRISGVTRSGLFVKLTETGADGFVPAASIGGDYWRHDDAHHRLVGDDTGLAYRLGDTVEVRLIEAVPLTGGMRFELLTEGTKLSSRDRARSRSRSRDVRRGPPRRRRR